MATASFVPISKENDQSKSWKDYTLVLPAVGVGMLTSEAIKHGGNLANVPLLFAPALSIVYGTLVELDDGGEQAQAQPAKDKTGVRAQVKGSATDIDALLAESEQAASSARKKK